MAKKEKEVKQISTGLETALSNIAKKFGKESLLLMGDTSYIDKAVEIISSGSIALNHAIGIGGYPKGRIIEIFGPESGGKTTLALQAIAEAQQCGQIAAFIDAEHAFDAIYATGIGINVDDLYVSQPDCGEEAMEIVEQLVRSGDIGIIVVDSVAALTPRAEIEGEMGQATMGAQARLMSQALRKLNGIVSKTKTCLIFINQIRMKMNVTWGNPETTSGGRALAFYASVRVDIRRKGAVGGDKDESTGNVVIAKVVKNKCAPPFRIAEFNILFGIGIDQLSDLIECGVMCNVLQQQGHSFFFNGEKIASNMEDCKVYLSERENFDKIKHEVEAKWK